jgi:Arc-like DNA binding domain
MARKRAPGGGRKPIGLSAARAQFSVRMPDDLRAELEAEAQKNGCTLTQEMLRRLRASLREGERDPPVRALLFLISEIVAKQSDVGPRWPYDPFMFRAFRLAVAQVLEAIEPRGEVKSPYADRPPGDFRGEKYKTPESAATFMAEYLLAMLMYAVPATPKMMAQMREKANEISPDLPNFAERMVTNTALDLYQMSNARDDLKLDPHHRKVGED